MTVQEMQERKRELGYTNEMLSHLSSVPLGTVQKLLAGITKAPRRKTVEALERVLGGKTEETASAYYTGPDPAAFALREDSPAYTAAPAPGSYTLKDYYALPDERRVELIDGVFYDMAAPTQIHQAVLGLLHLQLAPCVEKHPECRLFFAPLDVRLDNDERTMVQPDLIITCQKFDGDIRRINGAPDFVIEILSPSNRSHDMFRKLSKYKYAGVREYWIVDPEKKELLVYDLEHDAFPERYTFSDQVPVLISDEECRVDFDKIRQALSRYEEI
ncbi:MAG: Uma2 family endonuclease [Firmicutes bacterium]|nr:Uma2 family endonuclease [Lachnospiraceae bacterium]MBQ7059111.1 Uma2 family endonuclease [Bacillota bacterium]